MNISHASANLAYQGIQNGFNNLELNSQKIASPNVVDKSEPLVMHKLDANQIEASAKALKTADQMIGTIIDIMA